MADFPAVFDLATLVGTDGFRIDGIAAGDQSGRAVSSAGDFNGDGIDDFIIGAFRADPSGTIQGGETYVIYGTTAGFSASMALSSLDGTNGFRLEGIASSDLSGFAVSSAGDVNGDGFDDIIIGAQSASPGGDSAAGESYVIFGKAASFGTSISLASLDGTNGFRLDGINPDDKSGRAVSSAGDINGDGFDDIVIGARGADVGAEGNAGESYVVFGKASGFAASINLAGLNGTTGFRLDGITVSDGSGNSVSSAGDFNGDGFDDIIIGAYGGDPVGAGNAGESYIVFGKASGFAASSSLSGLDGSNGFRIDGITGFDFSGYSVSGAGDVNGDGFDDVIIGAYLSGGVGGGASGNSYVVFGKATGFSATFNLSSLDGANGFKLTGVDGSDYSGVSVSAAGDVNGDGFDDVVVGALGADPGGDGSAGEAYVVFGTATGFAASISLSSLDGSNGFLLEGIDPSDSAGGSVSGAGDINGDGFDDVIVGASSADPSAKDSAGESYVVFGIAPVAAVTRVGAAGDQTIRGGDFADTLEGEGGNDVLFGGDGDDTLRGGVGNDVLHGQAGSDIIIGNAGDDRVVQSDDGLSNAINGSSGSDTLDLSTSLASWAINLDTGAGSSGVSSVSLFSMENIIGSDFADQFIGDIADNSFDGGAGIDLVSYETALSGVGVYLLFSGTDTGGAGSDTFNSIENLTGSSFDDRLVGDGFDNVLTGGAGGDVLKGKGGNDTFHGGDGDDTMTGGMGDDTMFGGAGSDTLIALGGLDILSGGDDDDFLFGGQDADTLNGDAGADNIRGNLGVDVLNGGTGNDVLRGGGSNDTLNGEADDDILFGENHSDVLFGGAGDDSLTGGVGLGAFDGFTDTFIYKDTGDGGGGFDRIKDFENGIDVIDLQSFGFGNFSAVQALASDTGSGLRIDFGSGDVLFVENFLLANFDLSDVIL